MRGFLQGHMGVLMGARRESAVLFHIQTDMQVILDLGEQIGSFRPLESIRRVRGRGDTDGRTD